MCIVNMGTANGPNASDPGEWEAFPGEAQRNGKAFIWSKYQCLQMIAQCVQKLETTASSSWMTAAWDFSPPETSYGMS